MPACSQELLVRRFSDLIRSTPHRDITHIPYSQLFILYVQMMKHVCAEIKENENTCNKVDKERLTLTQMKRSVDSMLLSSLMAPRWNEVLLWEDEHEMKTESMNKSNRSNTNDNATSWYDKNNLKSFYDYNHTHDKKQVTQSTAQEMYTCPFLVEPLHGGRCVDLWLDSLRSCCTTTTTTSNTSPSATIKDRKSNVNVVNDSVNANNNNRKEKDLNCGVQLLHGIIPFTTLWEIKREAYLRTSSCVTQSSLSSHIYGKANAHNVLSLQERTLRQTLLRSLHYILELQRVSDTVETEPNRISHFMNANKMCNNNNTPLIQLHVMTPTDEFDALCQLSRIRSLFNLSETAEYKKEYKGNDNIKCTQELENYELCEQHQWKNEKKKKMNETPSTSLFKMSTLCNSPLYRLVYLCLYCNYLSLQNSRLHVNTNASSAVNASASSHSSNDGNSSTSASNTKLQQVDKFDNKLLSTVLCDRSEEAGKMRSLSSLLSLWCKVRERSQLDDVIRYGKAHNLTKHKGNSSSAIHHEAQQECTEMIRKLSNREECLRQMFSCR